MSSAHAHLRVAEALASHQITLSADQVDRLATYIEILRIWNRTVNLVGFDLESPKPSAISRILVEPLKAAAHLAGARRMLDVGSGGGSPGIPLAVALQVDKLDLIESRLRKATFLRETLKACRLVGTVFGVRFETYAAEPGEASHDLLTVRAVRLDAQFWNQAARVLSTPPARVAWFHGPAQQLSRAPLHFQQTASAALSDSARIQVLTRTKD